MLQKPNLAFPLRQEETATSYVSRLADDLGVGTPFDLCRDLGLEWQSIVRGDATQLRALAALGGANAADMLRWSIKSLGHLQFRIGNDTVPNKTLLRSRPRLCPRCVLEDVSEGKQPFRRFHWNLRAIRTCERHGVSILQLPHLEHTFGNYDFVRRVAACQTMIEQSAETAETRAFSPFEAYLLGRLRCSPSEFAFADSLPLIVLIRLTETSGLTLLSNRQSQRDMPENQLYEAAKHGFEYIKDGEDGIRRFLSDMQIDPLQSNASHKIDYGAFWTWLRTAKPIHGVDRIRDIARVFVFANYPVQRGTDVLGVPCPKTQIYSIHSAKREHGISRKRLVRCLAEFGAGRPSEGKPESLILQRQITADDIERILLHRDNLVHRKQAAALLGGSDSAFRQLRLSGMIRQHMDGIDKRPMFDPAEIHAFLDPVLAAAPETETTLNRLMSLPTACQSLGTALIGAAELVRSGQLPSARRCHIGQGLERILVNPNELSDVIHSKMTPARPKLKAAKYLRTSLRTIDHLLQTGDLHLVKRGHSLKGHDFPAVSECSLDGFLTKYTTVGRIAHGMGLSFMFVMHAFDRCGVAAELVPNGVGRFYLRDHLKQRAPFMAFDRPREVDWDTV
ncbi:TniQ family protein [uncultured Tateyamaria sp.]|uniref:TniQ family protein n=1 Tax=Tateyamaria sp. 1078 TaxID=3417464 RepID=UPI0026361664|nr:TniQ family protein [uncultured Tateyamaria sp.]